MMRYETFMHESRRLGRTVAGFGDDARFLDFWRNPEVGCEEIESDDKK